MNAPAFDTHRIVKRLKEAGFSDAQAETFTDVLSESRGFDFSQMVTKTEFHAGLSEVKADLRTDISEAKTEILKWMIGAIGSQTVVILGAVITLAGILPS